MNYPDYADLRLNFPFFHRGESPGSYRLFLISENEATRLEACEVTKEVLEGMLEESRSEGNIDSFEVSIVDMIEHGHKYESLMGLHWKRLGNVDGALFVPIFHNADEYSDLPQFTFDNGLPGIFSLTKEGYLNVRNPSKRSCFDTLRI